MVHGTVWKLEENPKEVPFWILRTYDDHYLNMDDAEEFRSAITSDMTQLARFYVDEIEEGAPFAFSVPQEPLPYGPSKYSQGTFELDTDNGPILCDFCWQDKWGIGWQIDAIATVKMV